MNAVLYGYKHVKECYLADDLRFFNLSCSSADVMHQNQTSDQCCPTSLAYFTKCCKAACAENLMCIFCMLADLPHVQFGSCYTVKPRF